MDIRPIRSDDDHRSALAEIDRLWDAAPGSPEADRLDVLATLVERYEDLHHPIDPADPVETIKAHMAWTGRDQSDLAALLGSRARASEILSRKRTLTMDMVRKLTKVWGIPAEPLIEPYAPVAVAS
ncbi:transcriptional regulator [Phreatobacter aquaticus]|uniref:Transcriptional regulator n=1 Tax=Phreatobacter aquaticus TaxID=2570229 RepID=A0A4D7QDA1_9HYPH|nr:transcriptional regulator [Phreatobacter aquaticus]QCK85188.1 transcriptional regulator [Phreatobacter aquaticus]